MVEQAIRVIVSRPAVVPWPPNHELRPRDFCWTMDGEILAPPSLTCADVDVCGCAWAFCGITSARAATWGVVEQRRRAQVWEEIRNGRHAGWPMPEGFDEQTLAEILDVSLAIGSVPLGSVLGIWTLPDDRFSLFDRTPPRRQQVSM